MLSKDELILALDAALDDARFRLRVTNDQALAARIGVSPKQISFWRNGRWTTADQALISVLIGTRVAPHAPPEQPVM